MRPKAAAGPMEVRNGRNPARRARRPPTSAAPGGPPAPVTDRDIKRDAVIRAAARAFNARGYHNTSLDDIAAALGVTKPTVYYYVQNKEQLLFECFRAGLEPIRTRYGAAEAIGRAAARAALCAGSCGLCARHRFRLRLVHGPRRGPGPRAGPAARQGAEVRIDQGIRGCCAAVLRRVDRALRRAIAFAMAGALNWIAHWYRENQPLTAEQLAEAFVDVLGQGLSRRPTDLAPQNPGGVHSGR